MNKFTNVVNRVKSAARRRAKKAQTLSALDLSSLARTTHGERRGAVIRKVFADLIAEGLLVATSERRYNRDTRHNVTVYRVLR